MSRILLLITSVLLICCVPVGAASAESTYLPEIDSALVKAGDNRSELEKVLTHYAADPDTLKYQAAEYLIANMEGHCYATYILHDTSGAEVPFNVLDYPDYKTMVAACDTIEATRGELDYRSDKKTYDLETITAEYLIEQIDYAFQAWREKPWARDFSYDEFCSYILPYRGSSEPLEPWRRAFLDKYAGLDTLMADPTDPLEAARLINQDIITWFTFDPRFYYHPTDLGLAEMLSIGKGRCEDMTNVTIYAMRANGLAVTSDYTPHWANTGNNHAWNAIVTTNGKVIPFMGAESSPGDYKLAHVPAKVYRKTFGKQKDNLIFQERKQESIPRWLSGKSYIDVTADYVPVENISVEFAQPIPDSVDIAYICVFNSGEWRTIDWARIENNTAGFTDLGPDIAYLPALYLNEEIVPFGSPFILTKGSQARKLQAIPDKTLTAELFSTTRRTRVASTDGIAKTNLTAGTTYELFYWADGWQSIGKAVATDQPLVFENVPAGCLYWLVAEESDREERIFTIENGEQVWW